MKTSNTKLAAGAILLILLAAFNTIAFLLAEEYSPTFWCGYAFITLAWICLAMSAFTARASKSGSYSAFLAIPQILYSLIYFALELAAGSIIMASSMKVKAAVVIQFLLFIIYAVLIMVMVIYKDRAKDMARDSRVTTEFKQNALLALENLYAQCENDVMRERLKLLIDEVRFSDPVSDNAALEYELRISDLIQGLEPVAYGTVTVAMVQYCDEIRHLLRQRNAICASNKQQ